VKRRQTVARRHIPCVAKTLVLAYGFTHELIADLVQAELATVVQDTATGGTRHDYGRWPARARRFDRTQTVATSV
jgi:hypothetical protein